MSVINSIKNVVSVVTAAAVSTTTLVLVAKAVNTPSSTTATDTSNGCKIFRIYVDFTLAASAEVAVGTTNFADAYLMKNPGDNLVEPAPTSVGTSNEKKFVIRQWKGLIGPRTQGFEPLRFRGWIKIPKVYQRMGTDDTWQFVFKSEGVASITCTQFIYKWFR